MGSEFVRMPFTFGKMKKWQDGFGQPLAKRRRLRNICTRSSTANLIYCTGAISITTQASKKEIWALKLPLQNPIGLAVCTGSNRLELRCWFEAQQ